jgi:DNA-binding CsgD family transcriptional regulator
MPRLGSTQLRMDAKEGDCEVDSVHELFLTLLRRVHKPATTGARAQEILFETSIDGARYVLLRVPAAANHCQQLSPREKEIVRMVSEGLPNKIIADVLNISCWTVSTHMRRIFAKLGVNSRAAMVAQTLEVH